MRSEKKKKKKKKKKKEEQNRYMGDTDDNFRVLEAAWIEV